MSVGYRSCDNCTNSGYDSPDYYCEDGPRCKKKYPELYRKKETLKMEDDFGFSLVDENELKAVEDITKNGQNKLNGLLNMILPLLDNLVLNPEKAYIHWPNRVEKVKAFKEKIIKYVKEQ